MTWPVSTLDDIFMIARGGSPRPIDSFITDDPDGINWVMISDASDSSKYIERTKKRIRREGLSRSRLVKPGDFLLTNSMSFGKPYIMRTEGCIHDGWLVLTPRGPNVDADFFYHLLGSGQIYSEFARLAPGATVKNLNIDLVKSVKVSVPPLREQRRIAAILDQAETLRAKRRQALAKLDTLTRSIFLEMFGDPLTNPKKTTLTTLGTIAVFVGGGTPSRSNPSFFEGHINWATPKDIRGKYLSATQEHITAEAVENSATKVVKPGTILVVVKSKVLLRRLPIVVAEIPVCFGQDLKGITLQDEWPSEYIAQHLRMSESSLLRQARGANTEGLTLDHLSRLPIIAATKARRLEFARHVAQIKKLNVSAAMHLEYAESLMHSLQHRAFRGEL